MIVLSTMVASAVAVHVCACVCKYVCSGPEIASVYVGVNLCVHLWHFICVKCMHADHVMHHTRSVTGGVLPRCQFLGCALPVYNMRFCVFLFIVFSLVAVEGLHKILPFWRPESAKLDKKKNGQKCTAVYIHPFIFCQCLSLSAKIYANMGNL